MRAIILAAGRGSRMRHLTDHGPKCLIKFKGKKLIDWQLDALANAGISDIGIVTGYKRQSLSDLGLVEFYNARWATTNMVSSLACANAWLFEGPCIVSYSDIFYATAAVTSLMKKKTPLAITYDPNWLTIWSRRFENPLLDAETFSLHRDGTVSEIGKTPTTTEKIQGQYMGLIRFEPKGWSELARICKGLPLNEFDKMHMTWILQKIIEAGNVPIHAVPYNGEWGEVDSEGDLDAY